MNRFVVAILSGMLLLSSLQAQDIRFQIDVITHMNTANELLVKDNTFYAATSGGLLIRNADGSEEIYNVTNDLYDHRLAAIDISERNIVAVGSPFGNLSFLDRNNGSVFNDQNLLGNEIVDFEMVQDTLWVLTTQFVSVYLFSESLQRFQFRESYQQFNTTVGRFSSLEYQNNRIWLGSDVGLISAPANFLEVNLYSGNNWQVFTPANGLPSNLIHDINIFENNLLLATAGGLSRYDGSTFQTVTAGDYRHIAQSPSGTYIASQRSVFQFDGSQLIRTNTIGWADITDIVIDDNNAVWIGTKKRGIRNLTSGETIYRDGPLDNYVGEILIDSSERIWCTTGLPKDERQQGLFVFDGSEWVSYVFSGGNSNLLIALNSTLGLLEDSGGNVWASSWGGGLAIFDDNLDVQLVSPHTESSSFWRKSVTRDDTVTTQVDPRLNSVLSPVSNNDYVSVVTDLLFDTNTQSIWVLNSAAGNNRALLRFRGTEFNESAFNAANWESYSNPFGVREWFGMTVDVFGDFWIASSYDDGSIGVAQARLGENNLFQTASYTESADNLKSNATSSIAADGDGYVWVGTRSGLSAILGGNVFDFRDTYQPLGFQINNVFVDTENNKWFATDRGISILKGSGSPFSEDSWIHIIPKNSSVDADIISSRKNLFIENLPSENVHSITLNEKSGDIYIGTDAGIAILRSNPFSSPFENFDLTRVGPNPFLINGTESRSLSFYNLAPGSEVRILSVNGQLIRTLDRTDFSEIQGNSAIWNGRNEEGKIVASGVYLYLITTDGGQQTSGKIMVVQE